MKILKMFTIWWQVKNLNKGSVCEIGRRVETLARFGASAVPSLVAALRDPRFREVASRTLGEIGLGPKEVVDGLINAYFASDVHAERCTIKTALGKIGQPAMDYAALLLERTRHTRTRQLVEILTAMNIDGKYHSGPRVWVEPILERIESMNAEKLLAILERGSEAGTRFIDAAIRGLAKLKHRDAVPILIMRAGGQNLKAIEALGVIKDVSSARDLISLRDEKSGHPDFRDETDSAIITALGEIGGDLAMQHLANSIGRYSMKEPLRDAAIRALVKQGPAAIPHLVKMLNSGTGQVGSHITFTLGLLGWSSENPRDSIRHRLLVNQSKEVDVSQMATVDVLIELLGDSDQTLRGGARDLIVKATKISVSNQSTVMDRLLAALHRADGAKRHTIMCVIGRVDCERALDVIEAIADRDSDSTSEDGRLARCLTHDFSHALRVPLLRRRVCDTTLSPKNRFRSLQDLWNIPNNNQDPDLISFFIHLLTDSDRDIRCGAAGALLRMENERADKSLAKLFDDNDNSVRGYAMKAIERRGSIQALGPLIHLLTTHSKLSEGKGHDEIEKIGALLQKNKDSLADALDADLWFLASLPDEQVFRLTRRIANSYSRDDDYRRDPYEYVDYSESKDLRPLKRLAERELTRRRDA